MERRDRNAPTTETVELLLKDKKYLLKPAAGGPPGARRASDKAAEAARAATGGGGGGGGPEELNPYIDALSRFGLWQLRTLLLVALVKAPSAWHMAAILFTSPSPRLHQYWCGRPAAGHWSPEGWRNFSQPDPSDPCYVYTDAYSHIYEENASHPFKNSSVQTCPSFEYDSPNTAVTQWNLVCDRQILVSVSQSFYLLGILVGGALCTKMLARVEPRKLLLAGMLMQIIAGVGAAFSPYLELQIFLRFLSAAACAHMFTAGFVICTDNTVGKTRLIMGSCYEHFWSLGVITLPCLASLFSDWRYLQLAISLPTILLLLLYRWVPESPRWLLNMGRVTEVKSILDRAVQMNGEVKPAVNVLSIAKMKISPAVDIINGQQKLRHYVAFHVTWAATIVTYYGALLNVKNIGDQLFINTGIAALAEVVGVLLGLAFMLWCSSKWTALGVLQILGGSLCFFSWILNFQDQELRAWIMLLIAMIARVAIAASLNMLTVTSSELISRERRESIMFSAVTIARVFLLSAPFVGFLAIFGDCVSLSAFGGLTALSGIAVLLLDKPKLHKNTTPNKDCVWQVDTQRNNVQ